MLKAIAVIMLLGVWFPVVAQSVLKNGNWEWKISDKGVAEWLIFHSRTGYDTIPFFQKAEKSGPCFYARLGNQDVRAAWKACGRNTFESEIDGVECIIKYREFHSWPAIEIRLTNRGVVPFQPQKAGLKLGIDTYMDKFPAWFHKYFPTLMRCEKTHFYGYLQTPEEHTLAIVSEQPVASWSVDYNLGYMDPAPHWFMGHRIESLNLDLLNALPLPDRHPQHLSELNPGESRTWIISLVYVGKLEGLEETLRQVAQIPLIDLGKTIFRAGECAEFVVWGKNPEVVIEDSKGSVLPCTKEKLNNGRVKVKAVLPHGGMFRVVVRDGDKQAEAVLSVPADWRWTMEQARANALRFHQKATSHIESWYGFYSAFIAARYFPDRKIDKLLDDRFELLFNKLHDTLKMEPKYYASRIQNTAGTIGLLVDRYEAGGNIEDLKKASRLADWLIRSSQREDGAYCNRKTVYTSVIYIAKSILELALAEQELGQKDPFWQEAYERHYVSASRAVDQLVNSRGNFETEGEMTFEDGMISCSALQIGMYALLQKNANTRKHYADAMLQILASHNCLTQLRVPDARRRQGTMRYWEAQYDVQMLPNMFNSPHGWSAWRAYATWYAYLLTGEEKWIEQTFNAAGAFANLIDNETGKLYWAFVVDPYLQVEQACSADRNYTFDDLSFGNPHPRLYDTRKFVIGEQYVNMVSDWQTVNTQDNDVHEVFKFIGEAVLTNAFVLERLDGTFAGYNCDVKYKDGKLVVTGAEPQIVNLHCNLQKSREVVFNGSKEPVKAGLRWFGKLKQI